ncbi:hypothetical protein [Verrucosispora sp. TAA-831]|uniref:hypothetical protein n=1 Tax=Verrucosispora sp. TAA-831 TaxID=3422227 RepID=UPI003D6E22F7
MELQREPLPGVDHAPAVDNGPAWWQRAFEAVGAALDTVPGWLWLALATALFIALLVMRRRIDKAHRFAVPKTGDKPKKLGALFAVAVAFAGLLWAGVLVGSGKNLIGWARDTLNWRDGWDWLVPWTLDGVAIAFALLMFVAVKVGRPTGRAYRVVWGATITSATIGFSHEYDGTAASLAAAGYLGLLALGAMAILHELLDMFRSHSGVKVARVNPVFGFRWVTWPTNTAAAWFAWQNHPPKPLPAGASDEQIAWHGSVGHAVRHLNTVRRAKRIHAYEVDRFAGGVPAVGWARWNPILRVRELSAALADLRQSAAAELAATRADAAANLARVVEQAAAERAAAEATAAALRAQVAELTELLNVASAETQAAETRAATAEQRATDADAARRTAETHAEHARLDAARAIATAEQTAALTAGHADRAAADLSSARELIGQLRQQTAATTAAAEQAAAEAADLRQQLTAATAAAAARQMEQQMPQQRTAAPRQQNGSSNGKAAAKWPTAAPWHPTQQRAFDLRDSDPKRWTWTALSAELGETVSTIRLWFANRAKQAQAVPTLPIAPPATTAVNGSKPVHA